MVFDRRDCEDTLQNAVLRAFRAFDRYHDDASFRAWMFKILTNLIFVGRCLERVGDHATNIAEDAVYAAAAEDIRHQTAAASV